MTEPRFAGRAVRLVPAEPSGPHPHQVIAQYDIVPVRSLPIPIGWVRAYATAPNDPRCYLEINLDSDAHRKMWPLESLALMLDFLLLNFSLERVHIEGSNVEQWMGHGLVVERTRASGEIERFIERRTWEQSPIRRWWLKKLRQTGRAYA